MSVNNYIFNCPLCGHTEQQSEGLYLFSDDCYTMLQCPQCKAVRSFKLTETAFNETDYPLCQDCNTRMIEWNKSCPECGSKMEISSWYSDTI